MPHQNQIFQTNNPVRWKSFLWTARVLMFLIALSLVILIYSLLTYNHVHIPEFSSQKTIYRKLTNSQLKQQLNKADFENVDSILYKIRNSKRYNYYRPQVEKAMVTGEYYPVRAGFYVNWDPQSLISLRTNIKKLNMVLPEWLSLPDNSGNITLDIDSLALNLIRKQKIAIVPMLTNYVNGGFNGKNIHQIITSPQKRTLLIKNLVHIMHQYNFQGVNIDFEDLTGETTDEYLIQFQKELHTVFSRENLIVTQDVAPFNNDYNIRALASYNDLVFLMGYDEHNETSAPGTIAAQSWVADALTDIRKSIDPAKLVLCVPAYGYDWPDGNEGEEISYQDAVNSAIDEGSKLIYDPQNSNLHYAYTDDDSLKHQVYFADAITGFNLIRIAEDFGAAGVALWRLGAEDSRIWKFYNQRLNLNNVEKLGNNPYNLSHFASAFNVDYIGQGEILEVAGVPSDGFTSLHMDTTSYLFDNQTYVRLPESYLMKRTGIATKKIALTFDDGPDEEYTPAILDILKKYNIHATFFITGTNAENHIPLVKDIYNSGSEIGNHTLTHPNLEKISTDRLKVELRTTQLLIESITGHSTIMFRPPYNTDSEPRDPEEIKPLAAAQQEGYLTIGSSIDPTDWMEGISADSIVSKVIQQQNLGNVILMHDAGGKREQTIKALPRVIEYFRRKGYQFVTISELMGKKRDEVMPPVSDAKKLTLLADSAIFETTYFYQHIIATVFFLALFLTVGRMLTIALLAYLQRKREKKQKWSGSQYPKVSIIVPGYNEEVNILKTMDNLLKCNYPDFEIIMVDDGSKDKTYQLVSEKYSNHPIVKCFTKSNGGKASALNYGIEKSTGEFLVCIDADTVLLPDAVGNMMKLFQNENIAAVAGNVQVGNTENLLTHWQSIEYTSSQNFDRRAFDFMNAIMVIPGAIGAFRKRVVEEVGGFTTDTLAEDCDLTLRILRAGYQVKTCNDAVSRTEAPETVKMFLKQRFRWSFGIMQSFWKHHDLLFASRPANLGWVVLPNILIFQLLLPIISPLVDLLFILALFSHNALPVIIAYLAYFVIDLLITTLAFRFDNQRFTFKKAGYFFLQRIIYRQFYFYILIKSYIKAIKGELISWGFLKRTGNVKEN